MTTSPASARPPLNSGADAGADVPVSRAVAPVSSGGFPDTSEAWRHRSWFNQAWQGYLRANFPSIAAAARAFHVDERTARDWWNGRCAPSGPFVAYAFKVMPDQARAWLIGGCRYLTSEFGRFLLPAAGYATPGAGPNLPKPALPGVAT